MEVGWWMRPGQSNGVRSNGFRGGITTWFNPVFIVHQHAAKTLPHGENS